MKGDFFDRSWRYSCALMSAPRARPAVGDWDRTLPYRHTMPYSSPVYTLQYYTQWVLPHKSCHAILQSRLYTTIWYPVSDVILPCHPIYCSMPYCSHVCTLPYHDNHWLQGIMSLWGHTMWLRWKSAISYPLHFFWTHSSLHLLCYNQLYLLFSWQLSPRSICSRMKKEAERILAIQS